MHLKMSVLTSGIVDVVVVPTLEVVPRVSDKVAWPDVPYPTPPTPPGWP